jgi:broad specificity phosphatase PhoE
LAGTSFFITHPEVIVDAALPVTGWSLSEVGRQRMHRFVTGGTLANVTRVYSSSERKALEAAEIVSTWLRLSVSVVPALGNYYRVDTASRRLEPDS